MRKIKLNERQILMLKNIDNKMSGKNKTLKITENQYKRLFKEGTLSKVTNKNINESKKKIDILEFAEEIIVFIKDVLSNPRTMKFSKYWEDLGISKNELFDLAKKNNLLTFTEGNEVIAPKIGFRKNIKEMYKTISGTNTSLNEFGDAGYPAGASNDSSSAYNEPMQTNNEPQEEIITISDSDKKFHLIGMSSDGKLGFFKGGKDIFISNIDDTNINQDPEVFGGKIYVYDYDGQIDNITGQGFEDYINDMYREGVRPVRNDKTNSFPVPTLLTPTVKRTILSMYGDDPAVLQMLGGQLPETTVAGSSGDGGSSGPFVGKMGSTIKRETGYSPEDSMKNINDGVDMHESMESDKLAMLIDDAINQVDENLNYEDFAEAVAKILTNSYGSHLFDKFLEVLKHYLPNPLGETTSTTTVGAGVGANGQGTQTNPQYAYDTPGFSKNNSSGVDMFAGNKLNKGNGKKNNGTIGVPIVQAEQAGEDTTLFKEEMNKRQEYLAALDNWKTAQFMSKDDPKRQNVKNNLLMKAKALGIDLQLRENKKLKVTEAQLKRIIESENLNSTAYPNGEMVGFDNCTKLNNNKVPQNGGCSQGDDGVVKLNKTKDSVVSKNN